MVDNGFTNINSEFKTLTQLKYISILIYPDKKAYSPKASIRQNTPFHAQKIEEILMNFKLPIWLLYIWTSFNCHGVRTKQIERRRRSRNLERICNNRVCNTCGRVLNRFGSKNRKYQVSCQFQK